MGTGTNVSYDRFSTNQTLSTNMLVVPFFSQSPAVGVAKYSRVHGFEITAANTGSKKFTIAGDHTDVFKNGTSFEVRAAIGNDGTFTCNGNSTLVTTNTEIVVNEAVSDANACGVIDVGGKAEYTVELQVDPDETAGEGTIQPWARFKIVPSISGSDGTGTVTYVVTFTPIQGGGSAGTASTYTFTHPETMDAFQAAAGRARQ